MKRSDRLLKAVATFNRAVVITHNYPDPDAMASAWGLKILIESKILVPCRVLAGGSILRAENLKFLELLEPPLELVETYAPTSDEALIFVDCQPGNGNHLLSNQSIKAAAVIDHHPPAQAKPRSLFRDVRSGVASCSTLVTAYLLEQSIHPKAKLSTALFLGVSSDIARQPILTPIDQRAVRGLAKEIDFNLAIKIQNAPYPRTLYQRFHDALESTQLIGGTAVCLATKADSPAGMAGLADILIRCDEVHAVLLVARIGNDCFITVRGRSQDRHAGELAEALTRAMGSGGGHADRAAGKITITAERGVEEIQAELLRRWRVILDLGAIGAVPFLDASQNSQNQFGR
ncbi:MAG: DHH family phosphoesterase [Desulfobacteraceae bacterium]|nr:DHH family phosphoesterase [Desulfobacteraceae bacterium]